MANEEHLSILKQGIEVWNGWCVKNRKIYPDLSEANLISVNLSGADLRKADLSRADLSNANLSNANLSRANLSRANLNFVHASVANLRSANLRIADLRRADLSRANLSYAGLSYADLGGADLHNADLSLAEIGWTSFDDVDLSEIKGLDTVLHEGPSYIDIHAVYKSKGNIPEIFLRGAGVPGNFITYMKSLTGTAFDFYSCFISYSSQDKPFVERLYADLQVKGVRCWYAPEDLKIGEPFLLGIDKGIRLHDKLLLVLSENSVKSGWVEHEVLSAMAKEKGKPPWVLFPIRLDDSIITTDVDWTAMIRSTRHIGNFTNWKDHDAYQQAFERLLRDLKTEGLK